MIKVYQDNNRFVVAIPQDLRNHRKVIRFMLRFRDYFDEDNRTLEADINYVKLQSFIEGLQKTANRLGESLIIDEEVKTFIVQNEYAIAQHRLAGLTIKDEDTRWSKEFELFRRVVDQEITRPLKYLQLRAAFYLATMKRAANFSVPGAGKTAMMYGAFAYLSAPEINSVNRLLVVSPLNAFEAWRTEYLAVFGDKRDLHFMNLKDAKYRDERQIRLDWSMSNVIVINYESLSSKLNILNPLIDGNTMIVYDEVHRVKNPEGHRAQAALNIGPQAQMRYVLTGTPIPNSYTDIYNFLHLLYKDEYESHFGWQIAELKTPNTDEVNEKLAPFFWRTNKIDLAVPPADSDIMKIVPSNPTMDALAEIIWANESGILAKLTRLIQASTNPSLLLQKINYSEIGFLEDEIDFSVEEALDDDEAAVARENLYQKLDVGNLISPKFQAGIELILDLTKQGKKVIVWGMFVDTMQKIQQRLREEGIRVNLVYGGTPKEERVGLIDDFRDGDVQVMISNPATLGESISLHQTVHDAVYFEYNFNLTFMLQSRDRIHRLGLPDNQYTRYYYLQMAGDQAHGSFIDQEIYERLKEKEKIMADAIDGDQLIPMIEDNYLDDAKKIILAQLRRDAQPLKKTSVLTHLKENNQKSMTINGKTYKALSIKNPWAWQILTGEKTEEYRTWLPGDTKEFVLVSSSSPEPGYNTVGLPNSHALALVEITGVKKQRDVYAWQIRLKAPIKPFPVKGKLHFYELDNVELLNQAMIDAMQAYLTYGEDDSAAQPYVDWLVNDLMNGIGAEQLNKKWRKVYDANNGDWNAVVAEWKRQNI